MKDYEINDETLAIIPDDIWNSIVVEDNCDYVVSGKPLEIVDYSCKYFGSSYPGRKEGSVYKDTGCGLHCAGAGTEPEYFLKKHSEQKHSRKFRECFVFTGISRVEGSSGKYGK